MGAMGADGMADAMRDGLVGLRPAITWHLRSNHFPPVPLPMVDVALAALADPEGMVTLPDGVEYRDGRTEVEAWAIIESFHLDAFLVDEDDDDDDDDTPITDD